MKKFLPLVTSASFLFLAPSAVAGQFCAVGNFGTSGPCFAVLSMCENWVRSQRGTCVFRETAESSSAPAPGSMQEAYQAGQGLGLLLRALTEESAASKASSAREEEARILEYQRQLQMDRSAVNAPLEKSKPVTVNPQSFDLITAEKTCADIGFKKGTTKYGDCVLELVKRSQ